MDALLALCNQHGVVLVEDAAHAHGSEWGGVRIGNLGHIACFSMQGSTPGGKPVAAGEGGIIATNDRELYERCLMYAHLHRPGAVDELTNPVYKHLDAQLLGWKWRAYPLAVAIARVSLQSLTHRLERFAANRDELAAGIRGVPGIELAHNYPKAKAAELYGGLRFLYEPAAFHGLSADRFCAALRAEGVPMSPSGFRRPEHLRAIFTMDLPGLWGKGHVGPANIPLPRYQRGAFPISEGLDGRVLALGGWIETTPGLISQVATAISKVAEQHRKLIELK
jgi:dTDP-4-amino-4,6-dideoxygalactose transaminase